MSYTLIRRLAAGGMGEVFLARRHDSTEEVALKLLLPHLLDEPAVRQRFEAEARLARTLHHPNIVRVHDVGVLGERPFIAMTYVDGLSLAGLLERSEAPLALPVLRLLAARLLAALTHLHERAEGSVVHRDISPSNVLLSRDGAVVLTDFGIALQAGATRSEGGGLRGKLAYLAPEQLVDGPLDARTDVYAAGVTLYEAATGHNPFEGLTLEQLMQPNARRVPRASELRPELTPRMADALERALAPTPADRFASAADFAAAFIDGPPADDALLAARVQAACPAEATVSHATQDANDTKNVRPPSRPRRVAWGGLALLGAGALAALAWPTRTMTHEAPLQSEPPLPTTLPLVSAVTLPPRAPGPWRRQTVCIGVQATDVLLDGEPATDGCRSLAAGPHALSTRDLDGVVREVVFTVDAKPLVFLSPEGVSRHGARPD